MRADLHTHTVYSDGELIPAELVRRAMVLGHDAIAITDHVDMTNVEFVVSNVVKAVELCEDYIKVIPGVEITHVPPSKIDKVAKLARKYGAEWIVVLFRYSPGSFSAEASPILPSPLQQRSIQQ